MKYPKHLALFFASTISFICFQGQNTTAFRIKEEIAQLDSLATYIDRNENFKESNVNGRSQLGIYEGVAYLNSSTKRIAKLDIFFDSTNLKVVLYCAEDSILIYKENAHKYYYINNCYYNQIGIKEISEKTLSRIPEYEKIFKGLAYLFLSDD